MPVLQDCSLRLKMGWTNYHTHCDFCDGSSPVDRYIEEAVQLGMPSVGMSSHAPVPLDRQWSMSKRALPVYIQQLKAARYRFQGQIEVYAGLEIDYIPGVSWWDFHGQALASLDYVIGSVHFVEAFQDGTPWEIDGSHDVFMKGLDEIFHGDFKAAACRYFELIRWMLMLEGPDILGHLDKIKIQNHLGNLFHEQDEWYRREIEKTLKVAANTGTIVEVNTRGLYTGKTTETYPSPWILEKMREMKIPVTISSDAHKPEEMVSGFERSATELLRAGYRHVMVLEGGEWKQVSLLPNGLHHPWAVFQGRQNRSA